MNYKTVRELSEEWGISRQAIQKRIKSLPEENHPQKIDGKYVISPETVALLEEKYPKEQKTEVSKDETNDSKDNDKDKEEDKSLVSECLSDLYTSYNGLYKEIITEGESDDNEDSESMEESSISNRAVSLMIDDLRNDKQHLYRIISDLEERLKESQTLLNQQQQLTLQSNKQVYQLQLQLNKESSNEPEEEVKEETKVPEDKVSPEADTSPLKVKEDIVVSQPEEQLEDVKEEELTLELKVIQEKLAAKDKELHSLSNESASDGRKSLFSRIFSKRN